MVVLQCDIALHRHVIAGVRPQQSRALVHVIVPSHDALLNHAAVLNNTSAHDRAVPDHTVVAHTHALTNHHVRTNSATRTDLCGRVLCITLHPHTNQQHIALDALSAGKLAAIHLLLGLANKIEIERSACYEVLRLANIHPEAVQHDGVQLLVVRHEGEDVSLDGCGLVLDITDMESKYGNALQNRRSEHVDAGIDVIANVLLWLLDKAVNQALL